MDLTENVENQSNAVRMEIVEKAKDWAMLHGLSMRTKDRSADRVEFMPFTLLPSPFPNWQHEKISNLQNIVNKLYHRVSYDTNFLCEALDDVRKTDSFTRNMLDIYKRAKSTQIISLGLLRSDYMLDGVLDVCKQVEVNTIAAGHAWIGTDCARFHRYILGELRMQYTDDNLPVNQPIDKLCKAFIDAWTIYDNPRAVVLFIVEDYDRNVADQRYHEYRLRELEPKIHVIRRSLGHVCKFGQLEGTNRLLIVDGHEIAVVYFRSGYAPEQYPTEEQWNARLMIEQSKAIKCPTMGYFLAGTKKVQQVLAQPGRLERWLDNEECDQMRQAFANFYPLDSSEAGEAAIKMAIENPSKFVLKPQREGGGNNLFGETMRHKLESIKEDEDRNNWTLMAKIPAKVHRNYLIRPDSSEPNRAMDVTSEIGIFGAVLGDNTKIFSNNVLGHMLRTKLADVDEGGVSSGCGACDSPYLV